MKHFFETIKRVKEKSKKKYESYYKKNSHGDYIIEIKTDKIEDFFEGYSISGYEKINPELFESLEGITNNLPNNASYEFVFDYKHVENEDKKTIDEKKNKFVQAFKNKYVLKSLQTEKEKKINLFLSLICLSICIIFFGFLIAIDFIPQLWNIPDSIWEIFVVIGWVFGWEAIDRLCFNHPHLNNQQIKNYMMYHCKFRFTKSKKQTGKSDDAIDLAGVLPSFKKIEDAIKKEENKIQQELAKQNSTTTSADKQQEKGDEKPTVIETKHEEKAN